MKADTESQKKKGSNFFHYLHTSLSKIYNWLIKRKSTYKKNTTLRFESSNNN